MVNLGNLNFPHFLVYNYLSICNFPYFLTDKQKTEKGREIQITQISYIFRDFFRVLESLLILLDSTTSI